MKTYMDKNGEKIQAGDTLYNPYDRDGYHQVLSDGDELYLGDFDSPLYLYHPEHFWSRVKAETPEGVSHSAAEATEGA